MPKTFVPPSTNPKSKIAIVAEQPGRVEIERNEYFVGPAGENLNECLHSANINREDCYLTNVIKDADYDIKEYIDLKKIHVKISDIGKYYIDILRAELSATSANVIVACGNTALFALTNRIGIEKWRGSILESTLLPGRKVIPTIHPAIYTQEKLFSKPDLYLNRYLIIFDLKKAKYESQFPEIRITNRETLIKPSFEESLAFLAECESHCKNGGVLYYDIEIYNGEMACISFAVSPTRCMSIAFISQRGDVFSLDEEVTIMERIESILANPNYRKGGQNIIFDSHFLLKRYGIRTHNMEDTMIAQGLLYPSFRRGKNLAFITSIWTDIPYYKNEDGKIWLRGYGDWEKGWIYNAMDSLACADAFPKMLEEIEKKRNFHTYERVKTLIPPLTYMMEHGIKIDRNGFRDENKRVTKEAAALLGDIKRTGIKNPRSPKQIAEYFYGKRKIKPRMKMGKITTDVDALKSIANSGIREASTILKYRKLMKLKSTYYNENKIDDDDRMRCSYNPVGTSFGRISSSTNIFGRGMNLMNLPYEVRKYFIADEGYIIYEIDLSQIEARIVAYVGNISQMIEVFRNNLDLHTRTASLIFGKRYDQISDEPRSSTLGDGSFSERFWGKKANHGFNYGLGPNKFSMLYELPISQSKWIHAKYHEAYPGVANSYWKYVQDELRKPSRSLTNLFGRKISFLGKWSETFLQSAYSAIPQGTCGDMINEYGINFIYYNEDPLFKNVEILTQVHDSIAFQIPLSISLENHAKILLAIIASLETPLQFRQSSFVIPCDLTINNSLHKESGITIKSSKLPRDVYSLVPMLEDAIAKF